MAFSQKAIPSRGTTTRSLEVGRGRPPPRRQACRNGPTARPMLATHSREGCTESASGGAGKPRELQDGEGALGATPESKRSIARRSVDPGAVQPAGAAQPILTDAGQASQGLFDPRRSTRVQRADKAVRTTPAGQ